MTRLHKRMVYGAAAAFCAMGVALDAQLGAASGFPGFKAIFDGSWAVARNLTFIVFSLGAATFGFLAVNVKE